jgi:glutamate/tyrosine decarboxylase-like PLP-dependent enzyme
MSLTANQLFRQYMSMSYEERQQFILMFKKTYDTNKMLEQIKREDEAND